MKWIYWTGWLLFRSCFRTFFGVRVKGREHLVDEGGVMLVANHESFLDPPLIGTLYESETHFLARKTLFRGGMKWLYSQWNAVPIDQERADMASLKGVIRTLKEGKRVLIFPEGARTEDGELGEGQPGSGLIAMKADPLIQPIRIRGARAALPRGGKRLRFRELELSIGPAFRLSDEEKSARGREGCRKVAERLMREIGQL